MDNRLSIIIDMIKLSGLGLSKAHFSYSRVSLCETKKSAEDGVEFMSAEIMSAEIYVGRNKSPAK